MNEKQKVAFLNILKFNFLIVLLKYSSIQILKIKMEEIEGKESS